MPAFLTKMLNVKINAAVCRATQGRTRMLVRALHAGAKTAHFANGTKVKVVHPIIVYHIPKHKEGVDIEGFEGEVQKNCAHYKGKTLSANFPYVVKFQQKIGDTEAKFVAHLVSLKYCLLTALLGYIVLERWQESLAV